MNSMEQAWQEGGWSSQQEFDNIQNFEDLQEYLFGDLSDLPEQSFLADLTTSNQNMDGPVDFTMKHDCKGTVEHSIDLPGIENEVENEVLDLSMKPAFFD